MTKEDILSYGKAKGMEFELAKFFSQNVCIPKGADRHPYADVLHEWIEGTVLLADSRVDIYTGRILEHCSLILDETNYRIKPQEQVYEWQAYYIDKNTGKLVILKRDSTDDYFLDWELRDNHIRIEDTKRIRK